MADTPTTEPTEIRVGDTVAWKKSLSDYPATTYTLSYYLVKSGTRITFDASASGTDHAVSVAATTTVGWTAGTYHWESFAHDGNDRYFVEAGIIELLPDFETATSGYDDRSHAKKMVDLIESLMEGKAAADVESYSIAGRSLTKMSITELTEWLAHYRAEYRKELRQAGSGRNTKVQIAFRGN
jgi:hypothetical protein